MYDLRQLSKATNAACDTASHEERVLHESVNWGGLSCVRAEHYATDSGDEGHRVFITNADPTATQLHLHVQEQLQAAGFFAIEVITFWSG